ncbi:MAG TPA: hypothetical protein DEF51_20480 [Myxococcales bacterium]|nr:hypothetical protein [Myxococcales bacterium]
MHRPDENWTPERMDALLARWTSGFRPDLLTSPAWRSAAATLRALPTALAVCPHGLELSLGEPWKVGVSVGFPFLFDAPRRTPGPPRVSTLLRPVLADSPLAGSLHDLLARIERCGWANTHPSTALPRPRIVYVALAGEERPDVLGLNIIFYGRRHTEAIHDAQWEWLFGGPPPEGLGSTLAALREAQRGGRVNQVGIGVKGGRQILKTYVRGTHAEHLRALQEMAGDRVVPAPLERFLSDITEIEASRVEDWVGERCVRMGLEIDLETHPSLRAASVPLLQRCDAIPELGPALWGHVGERPPPLSLPGGDTLGHMMSHLKVSVRPGEPPAWKLYLLQFVGAGRQRSLSDVKRGLGRLIESLSSSADD